MVSRSYVWAFTCLLLRKNTRIYKAIEKIIEAAEIVRILTNILFVIVSRFLLIRSTAGEKVAIPSWPFKNPDMMLTGFVITSMKPISSGKKAAEIRVVESHFSPERK